MTKEDYSIRRRLLGGTAGMLILVLFILSFSLWQYAKRTSNLSYDRLLTGAALSIAEKIKSRDGQIEVDIPYAAMEILSLAPRDKVFYQVVGPRGNYLTGEEDFPLISKDSISDAPRFYNDEYRGEPIRIVSVGKKINDSGSIEWVEVLIGQSLIARKALSWEILVRSLIVLIAVMILALACLAYGIHRVLKPLNILSNTLAQTPKNSLDALPTTSLREIKPLVSAIEQYRSRLQKNLDSMQLYLADASHQIRTSLSRMKAQLDIASVEDLSVAESDRLKKISRQHKDLTRLTNQLLAQALVAHRRDTNQNRNINLDKVLSEILTQVVRDYAHSDIEFEYQNSAKNLVFRADAVSLKEAIRNLLDNAIKYGLTNNLIILGVMFHNSEIVIFVEDRGTGIPDDLLEKSLNRFERLTTNDEVSGSGLGLAIVKSVVEAHAGSVKLANIRPKGLRVEMRFPKDLKC